jgi:hypothetical protein
MYPRDNKLSTFETRRANYLKCHKDTLQNRQRHVAKHEQKEVPAVRAPGDCK